MTEPTLSEILAEVQGLRKEVGDLSDRVGSETETDKGVSGTGLVGRIIRVERKADGLLSLKRGGMWAIGGALLVICIMLFGIKGTIAGLLGSLHH